MNIYQKIAKIMEEVKYVQKTGYNGFHKYTYAKEGDYLEAVRPALLKHGLIILPDVVSTTQNGELATVLVKYTIVNIENPAETVSVTVPGSGSDKGDKHVYKALTGSKKYFIGMTFLIETGDDAEADEETDRRAEAPKPDKKEEVKSVAAPAASSVTTAAAPAATPKKGSFRKVGQAPLANGKAHNVSNEMDI